MSLLTGALNAIKATLPSKWGFMALGALAAASVHSEFVEAAYISVERQLQEEHAEQTAAAEAERDQLREQVAQLQRRVDELVVVAAPAPALDVVDQVEPAAAAALNGQPS